MPLIKSGSDEARQTNIETEIHVGKPIKQAVAIGYSVQREYEGSHKEKVEHERRKYGK